MYSFQPWKNIVNHIFCQLIRLIHYVLFVLFGVVFLEPVDPNELSAGDLAPPSCAKYGYLTTMKSQMWSTRKSGATCVFLHTIIYIYIHIMWLFFIFIVFFYTDKYDHFPGITLGPRIVLSKANLWRRISASRTSTWTTTMWAARYSGMHRKRPPRCVQVMRSSFNQ